MKTLPSIVTSLFSVAVIANSAFAEDSISRSFEIEKGDNMFGAALPMLQLDNISGGTLSLIETMPAEIARIENLKIEFENAPPLIVKQLNKVTNGTVYCSSSPYGEVFYGTVKNQWLFREVEVTICPQYGGSMPFFDGKYTIAAKTYEVYNSEQPNLPSFILAEGSINAKDVTPNKTTDIYTTTVSDKPLTLELLQRPGEVELEGQGLRYGVIINADWMGHGERQLLMEYTPVPPFGKTIAMNVDVQPDPAGRNIEFISISYIDESGMQQQTSPVELQMLLEQAYGPIPTDPMMLP